jgi:hypothetical protein
MRTRASCAIARAMEFQRGEVVEWVIEDKANLVLHRTAPPPPRVKTNESSLEGDRSIVGRLSGDL